MALTPRGTEVWAHIQGKYGRDYIGDGRRTYPCQVVRDETAKTTTYHIVFPWSEFFTSAGLSPRIGLTVQVNDTEGTGPQQRLNWGKGADGMTRPGLFNRLTLSPPSSRVAVAENTTLKLFRPSSCGVMTFAVAGEGVLSIHSKLGGIRQVKKLGGYHPPGRCPPLHGPGLSRQSGLGEDDFAG